MAEPRAQALAYLQEQHVMTLATQGPAGVWAAAVFYAADGFSLYFLSAQSTRHAQNIAENPRCAAAIQENYAGWREIKGIQLEGVVRRLSGEEERAAIALYTRRFPFLSDAPQAIRDAFAKVSWYELKPDRLYYLDNSKGFGHRDTIL